MKLVQWQYFPKWHFSFFRNQSSYAGFSWFEYWITIGPIQTRWRGKPLKL